MNQPNGFGVFYPYQKRWIEDNSRFKIGLWARQSGKDFTCAAEATMDCIANPRRLWLILACGERQALESLAKGKEWADLARVQWGEFSENRGKKEALLKSAEVRWPNGSRLVALPARPQTMRGYSANLILTEFAFHEQADEIWRAIYPTISNPLRNGEKRVRIISTPNGLGNKFADLWQNGNYQRYFVDIHMAVSAGLQLNIEQLKAGLNDPDAWTQEYECQFMDTASILLPYDLIQSCESGDASEMCPDLTPRRNGNPFFLGIDFARKNHLTVGWLLEKVGGEYITREVLALKNKSTPEQVQILRPRLALAARVALDYTGGGVGLGDFLAHEFGEWNPASHRAGKVELCQFTPALKGELFPRVRAALEKREIVIPCSREIREDLHSVHRVVSGTGQISYRSAQSEDGHADRCTALALALHAAKSMPIGAKAVTIYVPGRSPNLSWARPRGLRRE